MDPVPAKTAEQLWQQCSQIYFAPVPVGHELEIFLRNSATAASHDAPSLADQQPGFRCLVSLAADPMPSILVAEQVAAVDYKLEEESCMALQTPSSSSEINYLLTRLKLLQSRKAKLAHSAHSRLISDTRPCRKYFSELEARLLGLYEKRPPSTAVLPSTVAATQSNGALGLAREGEEEDELCCSICGDGDGSDNNAILICDGCHFAAHQACYGVSEIPTDAWFCVACSKKKGNETCCVLCLQPPSFPGGSLMKPLQSDPSRFAHLRCVNWVPEAFLTPDGKFIVLKINKDRDSLRCSLCKCKGGAPVQCAFGKCTTAFHVSCAAKSGLLDHAELATTRSVFCAKHSKIHLRVSPTIGRLLSVRKQEPYLKFLGDKFTVPSEGSVGEFVSWSKAAHPENFVCEVINFRATYPAGSRVLSDGQVAFLLFAKRHPLISAALQSRTKKQSVLAALPDKSRGILYPEMAFDVTTEALAKEQQTLPEGINCCECAGLNPRGGKILKCMDCGLQGHIKCLARSGLPFLNAAGGSGVSVERMQGEGALHAEISRQIDGESFRCERCLAVASGNVELRDTYCVLCMQLGGLLVNVPSPDDESWAPGGYWIHPRCAFWLLPPNLISLTSSPPGQARSVGGAAHFYACNVCGSRQGCTVKCSRPYCERRFHVSCGFFNNCNFIVKSHSGLLLAGETKTEEGGESAVIAALNDEKQAIRRVTLCWEHAKGRKAGRPRKPSPRRVERGSWLPPDLQPVEAGLSPKASKFRTKRRRTAENPDGLATFHFLNGERVAMEEESWEGCCAECRKPWEIGAADVNSIACDDCDQWFHFRCAGILDEKAPEGAFSCPSCVAKKNRA